MNVDVPKKTKTNIFLANCIYVFHLLVVLFVLFTPFIQNPALLILHITFSICLLLHWWGNSNVCSLSMMESQLRGFHYTQSFTHKFISPIYDISKTEWSRICYIVTIILLLISSYYLYTSKTFLDAIKCYKQKQTELENSNTNIIDRLKIYSSCFSPLFIL